jgi:hypothetical protein
VGVLAELSGFEGVLEVVLLNGADPCWARLVISKKMSNKRISTVVLKNTSNLPCLTSAIIHSFYRLVHTLLNQS